MKKKGSKRNGRKVNLRAKFKKFWKLGFEEFNTQDFDINADGELVVREGNFQYNIYDIVKKYGTSTEIAFPTIIESRVRDLIDTFNAYIKVLGYKGKFFYHYVMKVNQNREFVLPAVAEGANLEVSSANELFIVKRMIEQDKFNNRIRVLCNGPKTERYIELIEELRGKGMIIIPIIENEHELERLRKFNGEVGIRVNLNIKINAHFDKKFNHFGFTEEELLKLGKIRNLSMISYHLSCQIEKIDEFIRPLRRAINLYATMREKNPNLDTINIGGGVGIPFEKKRKLYTLKNLINQIVKNAKNECDKLGVKHPNLISEWGTHVAGPAQITLFKVLTDKQVPNKTDTRWYFIDGSFINDLADTWSVRRQKWHIIPVNGLDSTRLQKTWIAGSSCDSDDRYTSSGAYIMLPKLNEDFTELYIAVLDTGAYQDPLASHHCLLSSPAKLIASNGEIKIARKRETPEDVGKLFGW
ncbi:hypothetical protein KW791_01675 [Candidatus Parcubacteria bacterium]|nr:hypothetical protein [Candidatus Parcubacteria bacterium]